MSLPGILQDKFLIIQLNLIVKFHFNFQYLFFNFRLIVIFNISITCPAASLFKKSVPDSAILPTAISVQFDSLVVVDLQLPEVDLLLVVDLQVGDLLEFSLE